MSIYSDNMRMLFKKAHEKRNEGLSEPEGISIDRDISYADKGKHPEWQKLDVYVPSDERPVHPLIINVHGGAWVEGDKEEYKFYCMNLAKQGYAVINYSYRLAPEYPFPAAIEDLSTVVGWVADHAKEYGFDLDRVYATGDSSGGHVLALFAAIKTGKHPLFNIDCDKTVSFRALGINSSNVFFEKPEEMNTAQKHTIEDLFGEIPSADKLDEVDLRYLISSEFPPTFCITGNRDPITARMKEFKQLLDKNGIKNELKIYGSDEAPLGHVFFLDIKSDAADAAMREELSFFEEQSDGKYK